MRALTVSLALLATTSLAACQAAGSEAGQQPSGPTSTGAPEPTSSASDPSADPSADPTAPAGDPLRFFSKDARTVFSCFPEGKRRIMSFDQVKARRAVTLTGVTGGGEAMRLGRTWVAPLPPRAIPEGGAIDLDAGGRGLDDVDAWADREPLRGAALEPGTTYTFFVRADVLPDLPLDDLTFGWDDGTTTGGSTFDNAGRTRSGGC